jgi:hypothetical protein
MNQARRALSLNTNEVVIQYPKIGERKIVEVNGLVVSVIPLW